MRARLPLLTSWCVWLALLAPGARVRADSAPAQMHPGVTASVDACVPIDTAEFHRVLALELGQDVAYMADAPADVPATHVRVACVTDGIEMRLDDPVTRKSMMRVLSLETLPDRSRTRLLALAAAEFVVASWIELNIQPAPVVEPAAPAPSAGAREAVAAIVQERHPAPPPRATPPPPPAPPAWEMSGSFIVQAWSSHDAVLLGGGLRLIHRAFASLAWTIAADLAVGRTEVADGRVSLAHAGLGGALLLRGEWDPVRLYAGPGVRAGIVHVEGVPNGGTASAGTGFFAPMPGPTGYGRIEVELSTHVLVALDVEAGIVTMPARALGAGGPVLELDGAWFSGGLALAATF